MTDEKLKERIEAMEIKKGTIDTFIEKVLTKGVDYGSITIRGKKSKPSLLKPGAEKFAELNEVRAEWARDDATWEMLGNEKGVICYICFLKSKDGKVVGEGRGAAKTNQKSEDFNINKQVKIAKKRSFVDAILTTYSLSEKFTQDLEDMPKKGKSTKSEKKAFTKDGEIARDSKGHTACIGCGQVVSVKVEKYSLDKFGKVLCYECQKKDDVDGVAKPKAASNTQRKAYFAVAKSAGFKSDKAKALAKKAYGLASFTEITFAQCTKMIGFMNKRIKQCIRSQINI